MDRVEAAFAAAGLRVVRNAPFAGAYVAQAYGRPSRGVHVVQVEIDRALYMDEARVEPLPGFAAFRELIGGRGGRAGPALGPCAGGGVATAPSTCRQRPENAWRS